MDKLSVLYCFVLLPINILNAPAEAGDCSTGPHSKNQTCCTNYYLDNGVCESCSTGFFGMNCSTRCQYPYFGHLCNGTCKCNATECNHVHGCQGNDTENAATIASMDQTPLLLKDTSSNSEVHVPTTPKGIEIHAKETSRHLKIATICAGTVLTILLVVAIAVRISNLIQRQCSILKHHEEGNELATIYFEINDESDQRSSPNEGLNTTVITQSCLSLDDVQTRPELPARNKPDKKRPPTNNVKDDIIPDFPD